MSDDHFCFCLFEMTTIRYSGNGNYFTAVLDFSLKIIMTNNIVNICIFVAWMKVKKKQKQKKTAYFTKKFVHLHKPWVCYSFYSKPLATEDEIYVF